MFVDYDGVVYGYHYSMQGDVLGLYNSAGTLVVEYKYDAWGVPLGTTGALASTLGAVQPFRYRGYEFDTETGLYYLRSRYYKAEWGRFVSADSIIVGNLFCYCMNNPIMFSDDNGHSPGSAASPLNQKLNAMLEEVGGGCGAGAIGIGIIGLSGIDYGEVLEEIKRYLHEAEFFGLIDDLFLSAFLASLQYPKNGSYNQERHHIVAQDDWRAGYAQYVLKSVGIDIDSLQNTVYVSYPFHKHMHTSGYHFAVNCIIMIATFEGGNQKNNVLTALEEIKYIIVTIDKMYYP